MLSIGEFSKICRVSAKTLRYYSEIGLIQPDEINQETGYRYYSINQLKIMILINRLKTYHFSLEEIKQILDLEELRDEKLCSALMKKRKEMENQVRTLEKSMEQLNDDITHLKEGKSILSYLDQIDIQLAEVPQMCLLSVRKMVCEQELPEEYKSCFGRLLKRVQSEKLTAAAPPMVLFHSDEFSPFGLDIEFALPVRECTTGTRDYNPGLCLKTVLCGSYSNLSSVYAKQLTWAEQEGYENTGGLFEVYVTDPSEAGEENELVTEIYYPVKKKR